MYLNITEVESAAANLAATYPSLCTQITLPHSTFEGRTPTALRLGGGAAGSRDCVVVICGVHAREWGSCEIGINFAADLLEAYTNASGLAYGGTSFTAGQIKALLDGLHLLVIPLVNPDGRNYSQNSVALWRRNRNPANSGGQANCVGVDVNRNFDFLFDFNTAFDPTSDASVYTSDDPCNANQVYHGPSPFSEPESRNVKWLLDTNPRTRWFLDVHSYSEDILFSWGHDEDQSTDPSMNFRNAAFDGKRGNPGDAYKEFIPKTDHDVAQKLAVRFRDALSGVRGKSYTAMPSFSLYPTAGASDDYSYSRHFVDPSKGKIYAYTIEWGTEFQPPWAEMALIVEDVTAGLIAFCVAAPCAAGLVSIGLDTPSLSFHNVPANVETSRAAIFSVQTCSAVAFNVTAGPSVTTGPGSFSLPLGGSGSLPAAASAAERDVLIWVSFKGTNPGDVTTGKMTVHCTQTGQDFIIPITCNTIAQPKIASVMVLDKSGSMDDPSGIPGKTRMQVLHDAAPSYPALLPDADSIGIVSFDEDAHPVLPMTNAGMGGRTDAINKIGLHATNPLGLTAIGDGVELAHNTLLPLGGFDHKAIVVFTDGEETASKYIHDISGIVNDRVFAIGLGTVEEVNPVALSELVQNTGGYLLMTDALGTNDTFRLAKYFVQILAGVTNAEVIVDPDGSVAPGAEVRVPFDVTEADYGADAIVLSPAPWALDFQLETPDGVRIDHTALGGTTGIHYSIAERLAFYRLDLPALVGGTSVQRGRWYVVLNVSKENWRKYLGSLDQDRGTTADRLGVPYSVIVHARSSLKMAAYLTQPSHEPGTTLHLRAVLTEIDLPVDHRARVRADVRRPDGSGTVFPLLETEPGVFEGTTPAPLAGIYPVRFRAAGETLRGFRFTREQTRTGIAWRGGNRPPPGTRPTSSSDCCCDFFRCLLSDPQTQRWLEEQRLDARHIEECLARACRKGETNEQ
jgi:murein tripeptide amidase MpaA